MVKIQDDSPETVSWKQTNVFQKFDQGTRRLTQEPIKEMIVELSNQSSDKHRSPHVIQRTDTQTEERNTSLVSTPWGSLSHYGKLLRSFQETNQNHADFKTKHFDYSCTAVALT